MTSRLVREPSRRRARRDKRAVGRRQRLARYATSAAIRRNPAPAFGDVVHDTLGRGVGPVRRAERVVHVHIGSEASAFAEPPGRSSLPPPLWKRRFSSSTTPRGRAGHGAFGRRADAVVGEPPELLRAVRRPHRHRTQAHVGVWRPFGRPRCDARMSGHALLDRVARWSATMRGCACRLIRPSLIRTLKSTLLKTRFGLRCSGRRCSLWPCEASQALTETRTNNQQPRTTHDVREARHS